MSLESIVAGGAGVTRRNLALQPGLARQIQGALTLMGLLDGAPDGQFGPVSNWALDAFLAARMPEARLIDPPVAQALLEARPWPLRPGSDFAGRVVARMLELGFFIARHPQCVNIVYVEGVDPDGRLNDNRPDHFNDVRMVIACDAEGVPVAEVWEGTSEPGERFTQQPQDSGGAARIAFDQFKAWTVGVHPRQGANQHEALVQVSPINVFRDLNKDFKRQGDVQHRGLFGINQHWGFDLPLDDIRNASAGCLVGRTRAGHRAFMKRVKTDARFLANSGYRFQTAVLDGTRLPA